MKNKWKNNVRTNSWNNICEKSMTYLFAFFVFLSKSWVRDPGVAKPKPTTGFQNRSFHAMDWFGQQPRPEGILFEGAQGPMRWSDAVRQMELALTMLGLRVRDSTAWLQQLMDSRWHMTRRAQEIIIDAVRTVIELTADPCAQTRNDTTWIDGFAQWSHDVQRASSLMPGTGHWAHVRPQ